MAATCASSKVAATCSVSVVPGATATTRIPWGPSSTAIVSVRWLTAALAAAYAERNGAGRVVSPELTLMITPPSVIARAWAAPASPVMTRFWSMMSRQYPPSISVNAATERPAIIPMLFTATSRRPHWLCT